MNNTEITSVLQRLQALEVSNGQRPEHEPFSAWLPVGLLLRATSAICQGGHFFIIHKRRTMNIPNGHQVVTPYVMVKSAGQFVDFATRVFGAEVVSVHTLREDSSAVIHAEMRVGDSMIMFADASPDGSCDASCSEGVPSSIHLFVYVNDADEVCRKAVEAGAFLAMEVSGENERMGGIVDPFGHLWWVKSIAA